MMISNYLHNIMILWKESIWLYCCILFYWRYFFMFLLKPLTIYKNALNEFINCIKCCIFCTTCYIEDEHLFVLQCNTFSWIRKKYLDHRYGVRPNTFFQILWINVNLGLKIYLKKNFKEYPGLYVVRYLFFGLIFPVINAVLFDNLLICKSSKYTSCTVKFMISLK